MLFRAFVVLFALSLSACAIVPEPIQVAENTPLIGYNKAVVAGDEVLGQKARWGGIITDVQNKPDKTLIEIVYFPLNHYGKPNTSEDTIGRFKAVINKFVDPILFENGRTVTFLGTVGQPIAGMVGEQPYMYPTIMVENYHLWRNQQVYDTSTLFFDYYTGWYSPFYHPYWHPYWRPWGFAPRVRVIRTSNNLNWNGSNNGASKPPLSPNYTPRPAQNPRNNNSGNRSLRRHEP
ncbi:Slp family lipoprotein [Alteromonas lipolytica]|uniref:Starvation-inducible protein n=1 Tax=Alteromonas lipolytica TaxID=1856405 RepID=A0A1E8FGJ2_9ALTE|nr:Slp family lipoprotein [Alteromonas lipolytica]OFI34708.1 hypothetical protein BFC17_14095 [Alteromonas lipolytica]GGF53354.1 hypothetical protein GCM10011338_01860 [Alteromonas lipolytica]